MSHKAGTRPILLCAAALSTLSACSTITPGNGGAAGRAAAAKSVTGAGGLTQPAIASVTGAFITPGSDTGRAAGNAVRAGPAIAALPLSSGKAQDALKAFALSCPSLVKREDGSGLTRAGDWKPACDMAKSWPAGEAQRFFADYFEAIQIGDGAAFATGYFEPQIRGSRQRRAGYGVPVYARPADLVEVDLGLFSDDLKGKKIRGRVEDGKLVQYPDRMEIENGALAGRGLEMAWAADPVEFFFLQIQGSGRLLLPDGSVMRIGYDGQNGRDYTGIGKLMRDRGLLGPDQASMQGIMAYLRANPAEGKAIMNENKSFIFFRELTGAGPNGAMGYAVAPRTTVAADPKFIPLGAPVFLSMDRAEPNGIWVAQDTGGAIKGANRFDTFWGAGEEARAIAGGMSVKGQALIFVPKGTYARLSSASAAGQ